VKTGDRPAGEGSSKLNKKNKVSRIRRIIQASVIFPERDGWDKAPGKLNDAWKKFGFTPPHIPLTERPLKGNPQDTNRIEKKKIGGTPKRIMSQKNCPESREKEKNLR